jgi:hypothetical protein
MAKIVSAAGPFHLSDHGKRLVAESMYAKGKAFLGAAILFRQKKGDDFVVLHLICQGIEVVLKGLLLGIDYNKYKPMLKKLGHNLVRITDMALEAAKLKPLSQSFRSELEGLNRLYSCHLLRYGSGYDIMVDPTTIPSDHVLRRMATLLRLVERRRLMLQDDVEQQSSRESRP